jgi:hypothetical protein
MVVRDRDAHSWAEVWYADRGWTTVDATPAGGLPDALFEPPSRWRRAWEAVADFPTTVREWLGEVSQANVVMAVMISAGFILVWGAVQIIRRRWQTGELPYAPARDPQLAKIAIRFDAWLRKMQHREAVSGNRTWREQIGTLENRDACAAFLNTYDEARFGGANGQTVQRLKELLEALEQKNV